MMSNKSLSAAAAATAAHLTASAMATTNTTKTEMTNNKGNYLEQARLLQPPTPNSTLYGEDEGSEFWEAHASLIRHAWSQWEHEYHGHNILVEEEDDDQQQQQQGSTLSQSHQSGLPQLTRDHLDPLLRVAVESAWNSARAAASAATSSSSFSSSITDAVIESSPHRAPQHQDDLLLQQLDDDEVRLKKLWKPVARGVYACQFLNPNKIIDLRRYLDSVQESGIPTRRPNGMNRYGYILEPSIDGGVNLTKLNDFYEYLVNEFIRPVGRLLFADYVGRTTTCGSRNTNQNDNDPPPSEDDVESYAFTVRYKQGEDLALSEHSDASLYTININLNLPSNLSSTTSTDDRSEYEGSTLYFVEEEDDDDDQHNENKHDGASSSSSTGRRERRVLQHNVTFQPGMAVFHRGMTRHAALPITKGERTNLIVWVHGKNGYVRIAPYEDKEERLTLLQRWWSPTTPAHSPSPPPLQSSTNQIQTNQ